MKKTIFIACIFSLLQTTTFAQNKHKVSLLIGSDNYLESFSLKNIHINDFISNYGISYEFSSNQKIGFYGSFNQWLTINWYGYGGKTMRNYLKRRNVLLNREYDKVIYQQEYNFINLGISYALFQKKAHEIRAKGGLILAFGKDGYLEDIFPHPNDTVYPFHDFIYVKTYEKKSSHLGGNIGIDYNYHFYKSFSAGVNMTYDFYFTENPSRLSYGIQLGYKF